MLSLPQRCDGRNWWLEHQYDHRRHWCQLENSNSRLQHHVWTPCFMLGINAWTSLWFIQTAFTLGARWRRNHHQIFSSGLALEKPPSMANVCRIFCYCNLGNLISCAGCTCTIPQDYLRCRYSKHGAIWNKYLDHVFFLFLTVSLKLIHWFTLWKRIDPIWNFLHLVSLRLLVTQYSNVTRWNPKSDF